jgi:DNA-binding transcriptional LysR family regulator
MVELAALRALVAVRDHGSVAAAAVALGFTPSAVSQQVKRMERRSRTVMLERVGRTVVLTERGRLVAERGALLLAQLEEVDDLAAGDGAPTGEIRIAAFSTACRGLMAPLLARLRTTASALLVTLTETDPADAIRLVERGGADLAVVHDWATLPLDVPDGLVRRHLLTDVADVLLPVDHPHAADGHVRAVDLVGECWASTPPGSICHAWLHQMLAVHGRRPDVRYYDASFATHVALVDHGVAVALVPRLGRDRLPPGVCAVPVVDPAPHRHVSALWRRSSAGNPARAHVVAELEVLAMARADQGTASGSAASPPASPPTS